MRSPTYCIVEDTKDCLCIRDMDIGISVTNGAEIVVDQLAERVRNRRLEYYDTDGNRDQIIIKDGEFAGFGEAGVNYG